MDSAVKDWIDAIAKIIGVVGVTSGVVMAAWQVRKARIDRADQAVKEQAARANDLETRRHNLALARATFWLTLRKMFADHNEVHFALRPGGAWYQKEPPTEAFPKVEAYMGLFEHCIVMLDDKLIDLATFKKIYAYRVENIIRNPAIVFKKLMDRAKGWTDFIRLVVDLDLWPTLAKMEKQCLESPEAKEWREGTYGQEWRAVMQSKLGIDVAAL